ncbi:CDF family Co(II)/Ni(II) efflux transporter DmeF [Methylibium sp.]|uniref:CDF family Co(II)/Ni(II) efflux transporter DmeF n=1 Tax=Methylibium sp. TaxID=2067992 RepID=UPI003D0E894F
MHTHDLSPWQHRHDYAADRGAAERRTRWVIAITLAMMVAEIAAGWWWHSMALLADGWHMGTHAAAIGVAALSYALARRWAGDARFSLGPWKVEVLGAYTSAVLLGVVAIGIALESGLRLWAPEPVSYDESLVVAVIGLLVNAACARLLHGGHAHPHGGHDHDHDHHHDGHAAHHGEHAHARQDEHEHGKDLNLRAAYLHVLADAATSVLAIGALLTGKLAGWTWMDPLVGLLGAALIAAWSLGLLRQTAKILLDREMDDPLAGQVRERLESDGDARVADLHLWRVGDARFACQATLVADEPLAADHYRARLQGLPSLAHVSIEINRCRGARAAQPPSAGHAH